MAFVKIYFDLRKELDLNMNHLVILTMTYGLSKKTGWCYMSKESMADKIGITRQGLYKSINELKQKGFLVSSDKGLKLSEDTQLKFDIFHTESRFDNIDFIDNVNSVDKLSKLSLQEDVNSVDRSSKLSLHNTENISKNINRERSKHYIKDFPSEKSSFVTLKLNPLLNNIGDLIEGLKHLYRLFPDMSQNKINDHIGNAVYWLGTKGKKNEKKDHLLFFQQWLSKNDAIANLKHKDEKPLTLEEITGFARLQINTYNSLIGKIEINPVYNIIDELYNID